MSFFNFIDTTFILTLGIILLVSGGIMIYCYRRLNILENSLIQQGRVLQEFISTYNSNNYTNNTINNDMCTVNTALSNNTNDSNKIVVSENDDSDSEVSDSDIDNDNLDESDDDNDNDNDNDNDDGANKRNFTIEKIDTDLKINLDINIDKKDITIEDITDITNITNLSTNNTNDNSKIIPISDSEGNDLSKKNPSKLRVDELRELAVNKNLVNTDDAQKLKKNELLKLLE